MAASTVPPLPKRLSLYQGFHFRPAFDLLVKRHPNSPELYILLCVSNNNHKKFGEL